MSVSVVVPVHRGWDEVRVLLASLGDRPDEIVVVDDASGDDGADRLLGDRPGVRLVRRVVNGGFAAAVNSGIGATSCEVIAVLNSDLEIDGPALSHLVRLAGRDRSAVFGPCTLDVDGAQLPVARRSRTIARLLADYSLTILHSRRLRTRLRDVDHDAQSSAQPTETGWLVGSCLVFHRDVWDRVGEFDEGYYMDSDEVDWFARGRTRGIRAVYVPNVVARHRVGHGEHATREGRDRRFAWGWAGRLRYARTHWSGGRVAALRLALVATFVTNVPWWLVQAIRGDDDAWPDLRRHARVLVS